MYLRFKVYSISSHDEITREVEEWAKRYQVRYTYKTIKGYLRVGFDNEKNFTLFKLTWNPQDLDKRPWLEYELIDIRNERY